METVTKIIKFDRVINALIIKLEDINAEYEDLVMFTEVRRLSKGRCLKCLYNIRNGIILFLQNENKIIFIAINMSKIMIVALKILKVLNI